jgi:hypothetical protein
LNVNHVHIGVLNVPLKDVSVPLTELNNHIVSVEMVTMMLMLLNVNHVTINVPPVPTMTTVIFVLLTEIMLQLVTVLPDSGITELLNVHLVDIHV